MLPEYIKRYNNWVLSFSKTKYMILVLVTSILMALALAVIPSLIDKKQYNVKLKIIIFVPLILAVNIPTKLYYYNKHRKNE